MPTPSIQTLRADAQQVLNLDSISAVRSVVAATLANANAGTPLNPNLTTQQLWNEFYQIVTQPKSDIESIIANQLMKFLYAPPAPGGAGADKQVIFNDGGVLAGDPQFLWNKTTNLLTVTGSATITGDLTVDTSTLKVDSANNYVSVGTVSGFNLAAGRGNLTVGGSSSAIINLSTASADSGNLFHDGTEMFLLNRTASGALSFQTNVTTRYSISSTGIATWSNVGGVAGTAMTLNATGLGVGTSPAYKFQVRTTSDGVSQFMQRGGGTNNPYFRVSFIDATATTTIDASSGAGNPILTLATGGSDRLIIDSSGNVGIGVTPTTIFGASAVNGKGLQGDSWTISSLQGVNESYFGNNLYSSAYNVWSNRVNAASGAYYITGGTHIFLRGAAQAAGTITPTESARIDVDGNLILRSSSTPPSLFANGQLTVNATSNTNLRFSYRGSDGTTRVANITLA